mmetsp:Transcript_6886/g.18696  ORF Transcript_6886/g.18696 Transcript_6886/m.18696 type:complete len:99 (+) Transcript_6886:1204-1500(+)
MPTISNTHLSWEPWQPDRPMTNARRNHDDDDNDNVRHLSSPVHIPPRTQHQSQHVSYHITSNTVHNHKCSPCSHVHIHVISTSTSSCNIASQVPIDYM